MRYVDAEKGKVHGQMYMDTDGKWIYDNCTIKAMNPQGEPWKGMGVTSLTWTVNGKNVNWWEKAPTNITYDSDPWPWWYNPWAPYWG